VLKEIPNQIEMSLINDSKNNGVILLRRFSFGYNWRHPYLFIIVTGFLLIIYLTPLPSTRNPTGETTISCERLDIITISQGLAGIKESHQTSDETLSLIQEIETLLQEIEDSPTKDYPVIVEKINRFIEESSNNKEIASEDYDKLQSLLTKLLSLVSNKITADAKTIAQNKPNGFSTYQPQRAATLESRHITEKYNDKNIEINIGKSKEQAISSPYLPDKYKKIIKRYFEQQD
jgi:hypothetical protein